MLQKVHQILVIAIIVVMCSSGVNSKHCTLDAMRNWAEEACENLRGIQIRDRRELNTKDYFLPYGPVKVRRDSFPHSGYLKTTLSAASDLHRLNLSPKYHVLGAAHPHHLRRFKRDDEDNRITHYCCQRECGIFTGC